MLQDQYRFILHHEVMCEGSDVDRTQAMVAAAQRRFPALDWFKKARQQHPSAESAIGRLEHCGLDYDRVLDHGRHCFERTVALARCRLAASTQTGSDSALRRGGGVRKRSQMPVFACHAPILPR